MLFCFETDWVSSSLAGSQFAWSVLRPLFVDVEKFCYLGSERSLVIRCTGAPVAIDRSQTCPPLHRRASGALPTWRTLLKRGNLVCNYEPNPKKDRCSCSKFNNATVVATTVRTAKKSPVWSRRPVALGQFLIISPRNLNLWTCLIKCLSSMFAFKSFRHIWIS